MSKKLHVLQVVGVMNRGGAEVMLMDIFRHKSKDIQFSFLVNYKIKSGILKGNFDDEIINKKAKIEHIGAQWDIGPIKYIKEFKKIYDKLSKPEVVHIHLNAKCGIIAMAAKKAGAKKIIAHSHADLKFRSSFLRNIVSKLELKFQKFLINKYATDFWGASPEANKSLFIQYKKAIVINNAVDTDKFQNVSIDKIKQFKNTLHINKDTLIFGNVGRIVKHKNVGFILDVLHEFQKTNSNFIFIYAGRIDEQDYFNKIKEKIHKYKLESKVIHLGNRDDVPVIVNALDVFIAPALKEGFGLVAVEAQAAGIPCLLYTGFPPSVDMRIGLTYFMNHFDINKWSKQLDQIKHKKIKQLDGIKKNIEHKGFDIKHNTLKIETLYLQ